MRHLALLIITFVFISIHGISQTVSSEKKFRAEQDSIYENLFTKTQDSKVRLDSLFTQSSKMSDTTKALNYNLLGIYLNLTGQLDSSIIIFEKALELNGDHAYRKPKLLSNAGTAHRNAGNYNQSLSIFQKLRDYYLEKGDTLGYASALGELAGVFNLTLQSDKAVANLTKSIEIFKRYKGRESELGVLLQRLANTYMKQEKFDFAITIYEEALEKFKSTNRMDNYYLTLVNVADCYQYKKDYEKALITINKSIEGLIPFDNNRMLAAAYGVQGDVLKLKKEYEKSRNAYETAISKAYKINSNRTIMIAREFLELLIITKDFKRGDRLIEETKPFFDDANIEYQYSFLEVQAAFSAAKSEYKLAFELLKQAHVLKDSSYYENKQQLVDDIQELYRVHEHKRENNKLSQTIIKKEESLSMLALVTLILLILTIFIVVIWITRANYQKRILLIEKQRGNDLKQKLNIEKENLQLKERLIEQQKTELLGYSMEVANMNEKIDNLIKSTEADGETNIGQQLKSLITVNKSWDSFVSRFKEVEPNFVPNLSKAFPELTQKDLEFCSLVRINVSYKDIANFLQISHDSVFKKRYRIAQKMGLEKGVDFQKFIIQF